MLSNKSSHIKRIRLSDIQDQIEPFIYDKSKIDTCVLFDVPASHLLSWNRFDLAFKLLYLDLREQNNKFAELVYRYDIRSQTLGTYIEPGNPQKACFDKYITDFNKTYASIQQNNFNPQVSILPLAGDYTIVNGAHRVATAIHQKKNVICTKLGLPTMICDYMYFNERNVPPDIMDIAATKFIEYAQNIYLAFLWPSSRKHRKEIGHKFKNVLYKKKIILSPQGAINLLVELYKHMDWIGSANESFPNIKQKIIECFPDFKEFTVVAFQAKDITEVRSMKKDIRDICDIGFSSIHTTDNHEETTRISKLVFNKNGLHFLNYSSPYKYTEAQGYLAKYIDILNTHDINLADSVIDGSFVLTLYGLRNNADVDHLTIEGNKIPMNENMPENHDSQLIYHKKTKSDLIYHPNNYFEYQGVKFISLAQLYIMKRNRAEQKDLLDCELMNVLISGNNFKRHIIHIRQYLLFFRHRFAAKFQLLIKYSLTEIGIYDVTRYIYRKVLFFLKKQ